MTNTEGADTHTYTYDPYRLVGELITSTTNVSNTWTLDAATQIKQTTYQPTGGTPVTTFRPGNNATRGQICEIVYLALTQP